MPKRIQRKRTKGWKLPANTVCVGRPSKWGNPVKAGLFLNFTAQDAVNRFREWVTGTHPINGTQWSNITGGSDLAKAARKELRGKNLACWCPLDKPCHADVLLEIANGVEK